MRLFFALTALMAFGFTTAANAEVRITLKMKTARYEFYKTRSPEIAKDFQEAVTGWVSVVAEGPLVKKVYSSKGRATLVAESYEELVSESLDPLLQEGDEANFSIPSKTMERLLPKVSNLIVKYAYSGNTPDGATHLYYLEIPLKPLWAEIQKKPKVISFDEKVHHSESGAFPGFRAKFSGTVTIERR